MTPDATEPPASPKLPEWVHSIGKRLRHDLNSDMTAMPEKVMTTLLRLFQREHYAKRNDGRRSDEDGPTSS
jgi:hypothetical protein